MKDIVVECPICLPDSRVLIPAQTLLTEKRLEEVIDEGMKDRFDIISLTAHSLIQEDLFYFIERTPQYRVIFSGEKRKKMLLNMMENIRLPHPILNSLTYFRENDPYTYRHLLMVFALASMLSHELLDTEKKRIQDAAAAPTHDIGKMCIPLEILKKRTPLSLSERWIFKHHTLAGYVLLVYYYREMDHFAAKVARDHHEKRDGSGYPAGIELNSMMVEIVMVSDIYDALISPRPYRLVSFDNRTALEEITHMAGHAEVGWEVVRALIAANRSGQPYDRFFRVSEEKRGCPPDGNYYGMFVNNG